MYIKVHCYLAVKIITHDTSSLFSCLAYLATLLSENIAVHVNAAVEVNKYLQLYVGFM